MSRVDESLADWVLGYERESLEEKSHAMKEWINTIYAG